MCSVCFGVQESGLCCGNVGNVHTLPLVKD